MPLDIISEDRSFFDDDNRPRQALITLQTDPSAPAVSGLDVGSDLALPDKAIQYRLRHFPSDLYDLRDTSHLVRLMKALLGDPGVGQLRKGHLIAQFQQAAHSTHFYDLDRFYGAIFGANRTVGEALWLNPHTDVATQNEWDQAQDADATFRDRIFELARAINLGATRPGLQAAAEALMQGPVEVYEGWDLLDSYGPAAASVHVGRTGTNSRSEVIIAPSKDYHRIATEFGEAEANRQRVEDAHNISRVLSVLKPASVLLTVDPDGLDLLRDTPMSNLVADSNFWNIATQTTPAPGIVSPNGTPYPVSLQQAIDQVLASDTHEIPKPPWSVTSAARWSYAPEVVSVTASAYASQAPVRALPGAGGGSGGGSGDGSGGGGNPDVHQSVEFVVSSFNVLGNVHTQPGGEKADWPSGANRMPRCLTLMKQHNVSLAGLQECEPGDQHSAIEHEGTYGHWGDQDNQIAWRKDDWTRIDGHFLTIPYFFGHSRQMPVAKMKHKASGLVLWIMSVHNPADVHGAAGQWRTEALRREVAHVNDLKKTGLPVLFVGDFNDVNEPHCTITNGTGMDAAAGPGQSNPCQAPGVVNIDQVFGWDVKWNGFDLDHAPQDTQASDHPIVTAKATYKVRTHDGQNPPPSGAPKVRYGVVRAGTYNVLITTNNEATAADLDHLLSRVDVLALQEWGDSHRSLEDGYLANHNWDAFHCPVGKADTALTWDSTVYDCLRKDFEQLNTTHGDTGADAIRHATYALLKDRRSGFQFWYVSAHTVPPHLGLNSLHDAEHREQFASLNALYDRLSASAPVLIAGDTNESNPPLQGLATCWDNTSADGGIDNILAAPKVAKARSAQRIRGLHSDHPAVVAVYSVTSARSATKEPTDPVDRSAPGDPAPADTSDLPSVIFGGQDQAGTADGKIILGDTDTVTYGDGTTETFGAKRGILDPRRALAARYASEGLLVSHPYSGDRKKADS